MKGVVRNERDARSFERRSGAGYRAGMKAKAETRNVATDGLATRSRCAQDVHKNWRVLQSQNPVRFGNMDAAKPTGTAIIF